MSRLTGTGEVTTEDQVKDTIEDLIKAAQFEQDLIDRVAKYKNDVQKDYQEQVMKNLEEQYGYAKKHDLDLATNEIKAQKLAKALRKEDEKYEKEKKKKGEAEAKKAHDKRLKEIAEEEELRDKRAKKRALQEAADKLKAEESAALKSALFEKGVKITDRFKGIKESFYGYTEDGKKQFSLMQGISNLTTALGDYAAQLKSQINEIASNRSAIDTRLQGSKNARKSGSYWDQISEDITGIAGVSPLVKQTDFVNNVKSLVGQGIAFNVEQRAFLMTVSDKIAGTFDVTNASLLKLVRIQQQDTTAARLGMESALTAFLNNMYETTEYMSGIAQSIRDSLLEAESLMGAKSAAAFEYQVEKWMGSMYSVGASQSAVQGIAGALGNIVAGNIEGVQGGFGNLLIMAANNAGISVAEALSGGLNTTQTNDLLYALTTYVQGIYDETKDSRVVQQQYAKVFGLTASDLKAISNLNLSDLAAISKSNLEYSDMMTRLNQMASTMKNRVSQGELLTNMSDNLQYSLAAGIASNPFLYSLYTASNLLTDLTGGINFGLPMVLGSGVATRFNIAEIMRTGALAGGLFSSMGAMIGAGSGGGMSGTGMLRALGIGNGITNVTRGNGGGIGYNSGSGASVSDSGYVGNSNSGDVMNKSMTDTSNDTKAQTAAAAAESDDKTLNDIYPEVDNILGILKAVFVGGRALRVINDTPTTFTPSPGQ